jgi:serine/threonine protein kinase/tetratricopeptide (TPR) repeat protein
MIGTTLGHYRILESLGAGGMGEVYLAEDSRLGRQVAIKLIPPDLRRNQDRIARFDREARTLAALHHPNVALVFGLEESDGERFLVMEYVRGTTLEERIASGPMSLDELVSVAVQIADGLAAAHAENVVHRDLKPANVMLSDRGAVKILDFGIATSAITPTGAARDEEPTAELDPRLTAIGTAVGTAAYMSPEQALGRAVDSRSDLFSFGALIYEMATGRRAFRGPTLAAVIAGVLSGKPTDAGPGETPLPEALEPVVRRLLDREPARRFQSVLELRTALDEIRNRGRTQIPSPTTSIAVLPFLNRGGNPDDDYFSDGLSEELINALSRLPGVKVTARSSAFQFRGREVDVREVGRTLGVDAVLEGSVRIAGTRLRITSHLAGCADGLQLWSDRFDGEMQDVFDTQDEIVKAIVDRLEIELGGRSSEHLVRRGTENLEAYHLLLKARHRMTEFQEPGLVAALRYLEDAIDLDPGYADAYGLIAECELIRSHFGDAPGAEAFPAIRSAVHRALELDPDLGPARAVHGLYLAWHELDWQAGRREMNRALELGPHDVWNHLYSAVMAATARRGDEAVASILRARDLDPLNPMTHVHTTMCLFYAGRTEEAEAAARESRELFPDHWLVPYFQALLKWKKRDGETAGALIDQVMNMTGGEMPYVACYAAAIHSFFGREDEAQRWMAEVESMSRSRYVGATGRALIEIARRRTEAAIALIEQARADRDAPFVWLRAVCEQVELIDDDRIRQTMEELGLP